MPELIDSDPAVAAKQKLTSIIESIEDAKRVIAMDVNQTAPNTRPGLAIRKREAEDNMAALKSGYKSLIVNGFTKVFVSGETADKFIAALKDEVLVINARELYETWAKVVEPSLEFRLRNWTSTQSILLSQCMQKFMEVNNIRTLHSPKLEAHQVDPLMPTYEDVVDRIRTAVRNTNGDNVNVQDIENRLLELALTKKVTSLSTPVIVTGLSPDELQSVPMKLLAGKPNVFIEATKKRYTTETAKEALTAAITAKTK